LLNEEGDLLVEEIKTWKETSPTLKKKIEE